MPRGATRDREATTLAWKAKRFVDRRSFLATDGRIYLAGKDKAALRERCFKRDNYGCVEWKRSRCFGPLEMSHDKPYSALGDDSDENVHARCQKHHRERDGHGEPMHF